MQTIIFKSVDQKQNNTKYTFIFTIINHLICTSWKNVANVKLLDFCLFFLCIYNYFILKYFKGQKCMTNPIKMKMPIQTPKQTSQHLLSFLIAHPIQNWPFVKSHHPPFWKKRVNRSWPSTWHYKDICSGNRSCQKWIEHNTWPTSM